MNPSHDKNTYLSPVLSRPFLSYFGSLLLLCRNVIMEVINLSFPLAVWGSSSVLIRKPNFG
jgi:hypothetical protein